MIRNYNIIGNRCPYLMNSPALAETIGSCWSAMRICSENPHMNDKGIHISITMIIVRCKITPTRLKLPENFEDQIQSVKSHSQHYYLLQKLANIMYLVQTSCRYPGHSRIRYSRYWEKNQFMIAWIGSKYPPHIRAYQK